MAAVLLAVGGYLLLRDTDRGPADSRRTGESARDGADRGWNRLGSGDTEVRPGRNGPGMGTLRLGENPLDRWDDPNDTTRFTLGNVAPTPPEPDPPVVVARHRLTRMHMKRRWGPAEEIIGRPIEQSERDELQRRFEEIEEHADETLEAYEQGELDEEAALDQLAAAEQEYRDAIIDGLGISEEQYAMIPELPGGPLPEQLR